MLKDKNRFKALSAFLLLLLMVIITIVQGASICNNSGIAVIPDSFSNFTSGQKLSLGEQQTLVSLYSTLSNLSDYDISLSQTFSFYMNSKMVCDKTPTSLDNYNANSDIWFCFDDFYMLECNEQWKLLIQCGTFIQFHLPFNPNILFSVDLTNIAWQVIWPDIKITSIKPEQLCAGTYHVWFVYYSRGGKFIRGVKTIFISYPSCNC